ncbi:MAG: glycosyltransferase family 2 protein [Flavobacterium sp.]
MKKIALAILNWNGKELLEQFLPSLVAYSPEATIYLVDNHSSDKSVSFVLENFPEVKIIQNHDNFGFAKGYNQAISHIDEEYIGFINSDVEVTPNWLQPILQLLEEKQYHIIQPKILDYKNKEFFEYAGAAGGFMDRFGYPFARGRVFQELEKDENQYLSAEIFWASGACFFMSKRHFIDLDGFDEVFFAHQEEIDLCWRAQNKGLKVYCTTDSTVYHVGGATLHNQNPKKTYLNFRNSLLMLTKNLPATNLPFIILSRLVLDGIAGIQFLLQGKWKHTLAIIHAHFSYYRNFSIALEKRKQNKIKKYFYINSLIFNYYVKGNKQFSAFLAK